jgi:AcrR family transcriptional regulator
MMAGAPRRKIRRSQGRPDVNKAVGREALILAARQALKTKPPGEITLHEVAAIAGVDPALIRYYFGQLSDLMTAVAVEISRQLRERMADVKTVRGSVRERLKLRIGAFLEVFRDNPHYHRLVVDYMYARNDANAQAALKLLLQSVEELDALIKEAVKAGEMEPLDARFLHVAMAALCEFLFSAKPVFSAIFGQKAETPAFIEHYMDFVADLILGTGRKSLPRIAR